MGLPFFLFFFFSFLCVSSFDLHPDPCAIWESVDEKMRALRCHVQSPSKCSWRESKTVSLSCRAHSHGHMKVKVTLAALFFFNDGPFFKGVLFHLEEIFIVNLLPVARFEHAVPYVVFCLATLLLKPRISDLSSWYAAQPESLIQVCWWSLLMFSWLQSLQSEYLNFKTKMQMLRNRLKPWEKVKASRMV